MSVYQLTLVFIQTTEESKVRLYADEYMYLDAIRWIFDVRTHFR